MIIGGGDGGEADFNPRPARTSGATYYVAITRAMELSFIAKLSTNYQPVVNPGQPVILKIVVVAEKPAVKQSQTHA